MKTITTKHTEIGYTCNVEVIETALRERFGINDASGVMTTLAQHIWSVVSTYGDQQKTWGSHEIQSALHTINFRVSKISEQIASL